MTCFRATPLQNVTLSVPVDGVVTDMVSEPKGVWLDDTNRALWKFNDVGNIGSIRSVLRGNCYQTDVILIQGKVSALLRTWVSGHNCGSVQL